MWAVDLIMEDREARLIVFSPASEHHNSFLFCSSDSKRFSYQLKIYSFTLLAIVLSTCCYLPMGYSMIKFLRFLYSKPQILNVIFFYIVFQLILFHFFFLGFILVSQSIYKVLSKCTFKVSNRTFLKRDLRAHRRLTTEKYLKLLLPANSIGQPSYRWYKPVRCSFLLYFRSKRYLF